MPTHSLRLPAARAARRRRHLLSVIVTAGALSAMSGVAAAGLPFAPCPASPSLECAILPVPLDHTGTVAGVPTPVPGTINLLVEAEPVATPPKGVLLFLAGGPGQSAVGVFDDVRKLFDAHLSGYQLVTYDQRGTGASGLFHCDQFESGEGDLNAAVAACAASLGAAKPYFTTAESVEDIETLRQSLGIDKIAIWGTSYGTKVAEDYALAYPTHVDRLILDSVVPPTGIDAFAQPSFRAIPGMLSGLCRAGLCHGISHNPASDLAYIVKKIGLGGRVAAPVVTPDGKVHKLAENLVDIYDVIASTDLNAPLREELPAAFRAARLGDTTPLLRISLTAFIGTGTHIHVRDGMIVPDATANPDSQSLLIATDCEETLFPWARGTPAANRAAIVDQALSQIPASTFAPFPRALAAVASIIPLCIGWPEEVTPPVLGAGPLPDVPVLVVEGEADLRTPFPNGAAVAAQYPHATLLKIPFTGHSALEADSNNCGIPAFQAFLADLPVMPCGPSGKPRIPVATLAPESLAALTPLKGSHGTTGRLASAVAETLRDAVDMTYTAGSAAESGTAHVAVGGLRGGRIVSFRNAIALHRDQYLTNLAVDGRLRFVSGHFVGTFQLTNPGGSVGTVRLTAGQRLVGSINGTHVSAAMGLDVSLDCSKHICIRPAQQRRLPADVILP